MSFPKFPKVFAKNLCTLLHFMCVHTPLVPGGHFWRHLSEILPAVPRDKRRLAVPEISMEALGRILFEETVP